MQSVKDLSIKAPQPPKVPSSERLLIAASGTGGHLFPALAVAEKLSEYQIEWLGVPNRLETRLVPAQYPLHMTGVEGFQKVGLGSIQVLSKFIGAIFQVRHLLYQGKFRGVFTTGGYIAAPAIIAARSLGLPTILHESNALPGKVTRWLSPWCSAVALGFESAAQHLPQAKTLYVGTPVRSSFLQAHKLEIAIPDDAALIVVIGGSQGAVAVNRLVRQCAPTWLSEGAWIVHLTGENDPEVNQLQHPHYLSMPFYDEMAGLLQRADLAISRAGAGTLTELAVAGVPAILIPFPYAAEDHQAYNAAVFAAVGATLVFPEAELTSEILEAKVLNLLRISYGQEFDGPIRAVLTRNVSASFSGSTEPSSRAQAEGLTEVRNAQEFGEASGESSASSVESSAEPLTRAADEGLAELRELQPHRESLVTLQTMAQRIESLAVTDSAERLVTLIRQLIPKHSPP